MRPDTMTHMRAALALSAAVMCGSTARAEMQSFGDWIAACDNLRECTAIGTAGEHGDAYLTIERGGAPDARARITIAVALAKDGRFRLAFDDPTLGGLPFGAHGFGRGDRKFARLTLTTWPQVDALLASMRKAKSLTVTRLDPPGEKADPATSTIAFAGMLDALRFIDTQQQRLGTVTALAEPGDQPIRGVPAPPKPPVVSAARGNPAPPPKQLPAEIDPQTLKVCGAEETRPTFSDATRLSGDLVLYWFLCPELGGAFNYSHGFLVARGGDEKAAKPPEFVTPAGIEGLSNDSEALLPNPAFDDKSLTLTTFAKHDGRGDCGSIEQWSWDGRAFKLVRLQRMALCRGVPPQDWPVLYRAVRK